MLNHVEYPSSVKEGTETPGAFDQNGQRFYVLDRLQEQASRIRYHGSWTVEAASDIGDSFYLRLPLGGEADA